MMLELRFKSEEPRTDSFRCPMLEKFSQHLSQCVRASWELWRTTDGMVEVLFCPSNPYHSSAGDRDYNWQLVTDADTPEQALELFLARRSA